MTQLRDELSETQSRLTVRDLECTKLKEENKLMIKQLSGRRADQTQQVEYNKKQVCYIKSEFVYLLNAMRRKLLY